MQNQTFLQRLSSDKILYQISNLSHDLKNPLGASLGLLSLLEKEGDEKKRKRYSLLIKKGLDDIALSFEICIELSRLLSQKIPLCSETFSCDMILKNLKNQFQSRKSDKENIDLVLETPSDLKLQGDKTQFERILKVLLSLSLQYSLGTKIFLNLTSEKIVLEFEDQLSLKELFDKIEGPYPDLNLEAKIFKNMAKATLFLIYLKEFAPCIMTRLTLAHFENLAQVTLVL